METNTQQPEILPAETKPVYIPNHLAGSILVTLFCCLPFGIVSIIYAAQVDSAVSMGDLVRAQRLSDKAKFWLWLAFWSGLVISFFYFLVACL